METRFRRGLRLAAVATLALVSAGCWPAVGQGPDRAGYNALEDQISPSTVDDLVPLWTATLPQSDIAGGVVGSPVVSNRGVVVSDGSGIHGFRTDTGAVQWSWPEPLAGFGAVADPIADGDRVLVSYGIATGFGGAWNGFASWVDARTGAQLGSPPAGRTLTRRGTRLLSFSAGGPQGFRMYHLGVSDEADPSGGWSGLINLSDNGINPPPATLGQQRLYFVGTATESFEPAVNVTGVRAYSISPPPAVCVPPPVNGIGSIPCALWSTPTASPPVTSPVLGPGESVLYVGTSTALLALDAADGHVVWSAPLAAAPTANPAVAEGRIYVPIANGQLVVLSTSGAPLWKARLGGNALQPAVAGGVVFVGTDAGAVAAYPAAGCGAATCPSLWRRNVGAPVTGAPAVSADRVYVGVSPDKVAAFALP